MKKNQVQSWPVEFEEKQTVEDPFTNKILMPSRFRWITTDYEKKERLEKNEKQQDDWEREKERERERGREWMNYIRTPIRYQNICETGTELEGRYRTVSVLSLSRRVFVGKQLFYSMPTLVLLNEFWRGLSLQSPYLKLRNVLVSSGPGSADENCSEINFESAKFYSEFDKNRKIVRSANTELFFRKRKSFQIISVVAVTKNCFGVFCFFNVHLIL